MKSLLLASALALAPALALAAPITAGSTINVVGNANFTASTVTFTNPASSGIDTGSFAPFSNCVGCVTMSNFVWNPFTASPIYSATVGALNTTLSVTSQVSATSSANALDITDNALMTMTGFSPTPGIIVMTINQLSGAISGSFSATADATKAPEPASLALLGVGLLGLGFVVNRKRQA